MFFLKKKKRLHYGKRRIKVDFFLSVKNICFLTNDYFIRNSFYSLFFENDKANKIRSKDNLLFSSSEIRYILIDDVLKFTATLYIDQDIETSIQNASAAKCFDSKDRKIIIRQTTFIKPDEVVYKNVGFFTLSLDKLVRSRTKAAYSFPMVDPGVTGYVQASIVCKFAKEEDAELVGRLMNSVTSPKHLSSRSQQPLSVSGSPTSEQLFLYSEIFKESIDMHCLREQCRTQTSPAHLSPLFRISSDDDRCVTAWMQRQQKRRPQKAPPLGQMNMSYIVDSKLASSDQHDIPEEEEGDDDDDDDDDDNDDDYGGGVGTMEDDSMDPLDRSWNSIGQQKKQFICPSIVPESDELDGENIDDNQVILESEFDQDWKISCNKSFIAARYDDEDVDDGTPPAQHFDKEWNLGSINKKFISTIVELDEDDDYRLEESDTGWNLGKIKTNFLPPRGSEEDEERDYAAKEVDRDWNGISGLKKVFIERLDTRTNATVTDEDSDFGDLEPNNDGWGGREGQPDLSKMSSLKSHKTEVVP